LAERCLAHKQADAILIIHGTDTLAYTSSALAFLLQDIAIPVIVTGSQKPLDAPRSDAMDNLVGAMLEARLASPGVWVYFNHRLMRGVRTVKKDAIHDDGFDTPRLLQTSKTDITTLRWQPNPRDWDSIQVANVHMVPGYSANHLSALIKTQPDAIILSLYGLGTLADQNTALLEVLHRARAQNIILAAVSQCYIGYVDFSVYATGKQLTTLGVLSGRDITLEAAYAKLMVLFRLGYTIDQIKDLFEQNIKHEMSED
jgi:L-asparaginase